jgi:ATP-dependent RNA helicase DDX18/HAS1
MLSFLVPAVAILEKHKFSSRHGTGALVIVPSRETAIEMSKIASELLEGTTHSSGMIMDGANKSTEAEKLERGINLLIATPDRLLAHIKETIGFTFKNTKALCIYDAGAFATLGLEKTLRDILPRLPKKQRLTMVLGTSQSDELNSIAQLACRASALKECTEVSAAIEESKEPQGYVTVDADKRFLLLNSFLKKFQQKKIIVVMSSTASVQYHAEALNRLNTPVSEVHGGQNAKIRAATFARFVKETEGTLIITDEATRSLEMPAVDWVIQYDPPRSIKDFIQRRGAFKGRAVLFVQPSEIAFVEELKKTGIVTEEFDFPKKALINVQKQLEKLVKTVYELHCTAKDGFRLVHSLQTSITHYCTL